jgi:hypothetical protein
MKGASMISLAHATRRQAHSIDALVAQTLGVGVDMLHDDLAYQSIPEWNLLRHVALMLSLEQVLGVKIDDERMLELDSLHAIRTFADSNARKPHPVPLPPSVPQKKSNHMPMPQPDVSRGSRRRVRRLQQHHAHRR